MKMEYAPSDTEAMRKLQHRVHERIAPHSLLLACLSSHYMAQRLNGSYMEFQMLSLLQSSLPPLMNMTSHPLTRELIFSIVLLSLQLLRYSNFLDPETQRSLKDDILSVGLAWFRNPPRYVPKHFPQLHRESKQR